jgi:Zn-dependent protease
MNPAHTGIITQILIWLIPCVPAITLHEVAHGWMALRFGDTTARDRGRLSLNPIRHIDPVGTVVLPSLMLLTHMPFVFGWARPVPVNFQRLRRGKWAVLLVALAGPLANAVMLFGWLALFLLIAAQQKLTPAVDLIGQIALGGVAINLVLILFNLIPIPPLDGGRVIGALLPQPLSRFYLRLERVGILILLILIATGVFDKFFTPVLDYFFSLLGKF